MPTSRNNTVAAALAALLLGDPVHATPSELPPPLSIEPIGRSETLPLGYPENWFLVYDLSFTHQAEGRLFILDAAADTVPAQVKGFLNGHPTFLVPVHHRATLGFVSPVFKDQHAAITGEVVIDERAVACGFSD